MRAFQKDGGVVWTSPMFFLTKEYFFQNEDNLFIKFVPFPNPFRNSVNIVYNQPIDGKMQLYLYNSYGRLIKIVNEIHQVAGVYFYEINTTNFNEGIYIIKLQIENYTSSKRIVLSK